MQLREKNICLSLELAALQEELGLLRRTQCDDFFPGSLPTNNGDPACSTVETLQVELAEEKPVTPAQVSRLEKMLAEGPTIVEIEQGAADAHKRA